jgi:N-acetylmuramoyl-L-alanine amidase
VDIGKIREYSPHELRDPDRIYVDLLQTKLNPILHNKTIHVKEDYLSQIRIAQRDSTTVRVVADVDFNKIKLFRIWHLPDPFRVIIDIYPHKPSSHAVSGKAPQAAEPAKEGYSMVRQLGLGIQRIIIDPGHGGKDPGAMGKKGAKEKDIVLDVCLRLKKLFESQKNIEAILTRETDIFVPVENRTVIANQKQADIFISVHANAFPSRKRSGVETFFLNFSSDPSVMAIAARENATSTKSISEMKNIIDRIAKYSKVVESKDLAEKIQKNLVTSLSKENKNVANLGTKGGPFWVLIGGNSPSVLVEISHLSNLSEEQRLKKALYRQQVAQGIYEGIMEYIQSLGKG